ncbi:hypothetical protein FALBO_6334 [Fusarium albosuccineum]|uniref:Nonsense-mediated mRNA decay factor n=1 Tax=Fusarium albosuccineum TaxID=1237068 RepID=A0A8H4LER4_9HYPO|nr:hypothetical protein FALBO_6334 [Fusarium albosuccineum]
MAGITDRWVGCLPNREKRHKSEAQSFSCPLCDSEIKNIEFWRDHVQNSEEHKEKWSTEKSVDDAFRLHVEGSSTTEAQGTKKKRKRHVGDPAASVEGAENGDVEPREAKRRSPPLPAGSQQPAGSPNNRSRARNTFDQGRPHKNTSRRELCTSENGLHPKAPPNQARAVPVTSPRQQQPSNKAARPPQVTTQSSSNDDDSPTRMMLQPETRPISQDQLVAEVKGIYAGLVMVETKCIEVDNAQSSNTDANSKLNNEQWQALIALHRTLLHEHHDFFLASQHPSASPALRRLASKYAMPARMWRHGIHSFLELLRHRLPASLEHMLTFLYLAYSMMALLYETIPAFEDTWIECLGDLGRYRMAIEDDDIRDREVWTGVSRHWYSKASDKSPTTGRLYHHLAILARPNALQQLYYYTKSLCVPIPFSSARESIMTLFDPVLSNSPTRLAPIDAAFVRVHGILFSGKSKDKLQESMDEFINQLDGYIGRSTKRWLESGYYIGITLGCSLLGYGAESNVLMRAVSSKPDGTAVIGGSTTCELVPVEKDTTMDENATAELVLDEKDATMDENATAERVPDETASIDGSTTWERVSVEKNATMDENATAERVPDETASIDESTTWERVSVETASIDESTTWERVSVETASIDESTTWERVSVETASIDGSTTWERVSVEKDATMDENATAEPVSDEKDATMDENATAEPVSDETFELSRAFAVRIIETVIRRWGDTNTLPFLHTLLVFMSHMTRFPAAMSHLEKTYPWKLTSLMLNSLLVSCDPSYEVHSGFRLPEKDQLPRPLPEDFAMRGLIYSEDYYPSEWFMNDKIDEDEKYFELASMVEERKDRILSLGCKIATSGTWLIWDPEAREFSVPEKYDEDIKDVPT